MTEHLRPRHYHILASNKKLMYAISNTAAVTAVLLVTRKSWFIHIDGNTKKDNEMKGVGTRKT